jgi:hypothetical protein
MAERLALIHLPKLPKALWNILWLYYRSTLVNWLGILEKQKWIKPLFLFG